MLQAHLHQPSREYTCTYIHTYTELKSSCIYLSLLRWLKDGVPVRQGEGVRITSNGRRLVISRAQVSDTALFHCVATNEAGEQEREFKVSVHGNNNFFFISY